MKVASGYLLNNIGAAVGGVTTVLVTGLLVTVFLYFLLRYGKDWIGRLAVLTPLDPRTTTSILRTVNDSVVANVNGVFAVAVGQGLLLSLGFWFVGVRSPVLWGAVGGLASIIPLIGPPLVWVPVAIAFLLMGSYWKALLLGLWGCVVVGSVDTVLRPLVVGARERQHLMLIALAAIGGTYAFGPLGILLGRPPGGFSRRCSAEGDSKINLAQCSGSRIPGGRRGDAARGHVGHETICGKVAPDDLECHDAQARHFAQGSLTIRGQVTA